MGKTIISVRLRLFCGAHPHVCGEHVTLQDIIMTWWGSSPRMRRTPAINRRQEAPRGLISSPRMRGTQRVHCVHRPPRGLIPTYAGNTPVCILAVCPFRAHPHVCGEHGIASSSCATCRGSSPRMRGTLACWARGNGTRGLIPTYAGNTYGSLRS